MNHDSQKPDALATLGFTMIEVMASLVIMAILLGGVLLAYNRMLEAITLNSLNERAATVAQRHMEMLLASSQEPDPAEMQGTDELDPAFTWKLALSREPLPGAKPPITLPNTVIKAVITVQTIDEEEENDFSTRPKDPNEEDPNQSTPGSLSSAPETARVELIRYIPWLNPLPGNDVAVPLAPKRGQEPEWLQDLRRELGREPTPQEIIQKTLGDRVLPQNVKEALDQRIQGGPGRPIK